MKSAVARPAIEEYILRRVHKQNKNFLCAITGPTGSGKTYSALRMGEVLDPEFSADRVVFTAAEFMRLLNSGTLKTGSVIVFDEAGVSMNNREWQSKSNKLITFVAQTFRHKNYIVVFTSPSFDFVDSALRKLFHAIFTTDKIDYARAVCICKPFFVQVNQMTGKVYTKYLQYTNATNQKVKVTRHSFKLSAKPLRDAYELKKLAFTKQLNHDVLEELAPELVREQGFAMGSGLTKRQSQVAYLKLIYGLADEKAADVLGLSGQRVTYLAKQARVKGWDIPTAPEMRLIAKALPHHSTLKAELSMMSDEKLRAVLGAGL